MPTNNIVETLDTGKIRISNDETSGAIQFEFLTSTGWKVVFYDDGDSVSYFGKTASLDAVEANSYSDANGIQLVGNRQGNIDNPSGGVVIDANCRSTVNEILAALRNHGLIET